MHTFEEACQEQWNDELGEIPTSRYLFYMPDSWHNEYNARYDGADPSTYSAGVYWWDSVANPKEFRSNINDWPGYAVLEKDPTCPNIYIANIPSAVTEIIWNNSVDGGIDVEDPIYAASIQSGTAYVSGYVPGVDTYGFYSEGLSSMENMIYVINPDDVNASYIGKGVYTGEWFYYYGNGEYGIAPTKKEAGANVYSNGEFPPIDLNIVVSEIPDLGVGAETVVEANRANVIATSENENIAKVSRIIDGLFVVTGVAQGKTNILFESENEFTQKTDYFTLPVTVIEPYFDPATIALNVGESNYVSGIGLGQNAKITYSNDGIVTYDPVTKTVVAKKAGTTKVIASQSKISISFTATVTDNRKLTGIAVAKKPKLVYTLGEKFDNTGMEVVAFYNDNTKEVVTDYHISGFDSETIGRKTIYILYSGFFTTFHVDIINKHQWNKGTVLKKPSCTATGEVIYNCLVCGTTKTELVSATGHKKVIDRAVAATCTKTGLTQGSHCSVCETVFVPQMVINAPGHVKRTKGAKKATYFENGYTGDKVCNVCNKVFSKGKSIAKLELKTPTVKYRVGKNKITVKYIKVKDATGFEIKYKIGNTMVILTYNSQKTVEKVIKELSKGTYKVQVRAFVKKGKKTAYGSWTKAKSVKIK